MKKKLEKVLIIDDDADILTVSSMALKTLLHIEVLCAGSGQKGIDLALTSSPDLILLDMMMPVMDGITTMQKIKENPQLKNIPIIFFTAKVTKDEISKYKELGILDIITKPFDPLSLGKSIEKLWESHTD